MEVRVGGAENALRGTFANRLPLTPCLDVAPVMWVDHITGFCDGGIYVTQPANMGRWVFSGGRRAHNLQRVGERKTETLQILQMWLTELSQLRAWRNCKCLLFIKAISEVYTTF